MLVVRMSQAIGLLVAASTIEWSRAFHKLEGE